MKIFEYNNRGIAPEISIVCVTYNASSFIRDILTSFFQQDIIDRCEIIIGDDASIDNTVSLLQEFLHHSPCSAKLITRDKNIGAVSNWLHALGSASGKFIAYIDGDDYYISSRKLSNDLKAFHACENCNLVFSPSLKISNESTDGTARNVYKSWNTNKVDLPWVLRQGGGFYPTSSVFFKRSLLLGLPKWFFVTHCTGDLPLAAAAVHNGGLICYRQGIDTGYRIHDQSLTHFKRSVFMTFRVNNKKKKNNCEFYRLLHKDGFISNELYLELTMKEEYIFFAKLFDVGVYKYCIKESLGILSVKYLIRLYAKLIFVLGKNMHKSLSESFSRTNGTAF